MLIEPFDKFVNESMKLEYKQITEDEWSKISLALKSLGYTYDDVKAHSGSGKDISFRMKDKKDVKLIKKNRKWELVESSMPNYESKEIEEACGKIHKIAEMYENDDNEDHTYEGVINQIMSSIGGMKEAWKNKK